MGKYDHFGLHPSIKALYEQLDRTTDNAIEAAQAARNAKDASPPLTPDLLRLTSEDLASMNADFRFGETVAVVLALAVTISVGVYMWSGMAISSSQTFWASVICGVVAGGITWAILRIDVVQDVLGWVRRHKAGTLVIVGIVSAVVVYHR